MDYCTVYAYGTTLNFYEYSGNHMGRKRGLLKETAHTGLISKLDETKQYL